MSTHTDAEFAALKAELEHYKAISRTLSIDTHINVPFKQWKQLREELCCWCRFRGRILPGVYWQQPAAE